jgi:5-methylcytosine-specific restriction endonuclease McrA
VKRFGQDTIAFLQPNQISWRHKRQALTRRFGTGITIKRYKPWLCWFCGCILLKGRGSKGPFGFTKDHVVPRSKGGRGELNKVPACRWCNSHKANRSLEDFRKQTGVSQFFGEVNGDSRSVG